ncbi:Uncharacterised protein [Klebsiella pneumoniae]|nr:Uncharacterised protein [Klebsiella pneumoniae]
MQALASAGLEPALQAQLREQYAGEHRSFPQHRPGNPFSGIEIEYEAIGLIDARNLGVPRVEFDDVHLRGLDEGFRGVDREQGCVPWP